MASSLNPADIVSIVLYFIVLLAIAFFLSCRNAGSTSSEGYFLAGRHSAFWAIGCSLFASNIGSEHLIGLTGSGASAAGLSAAWGEWLSPFCILLLSWVFLPFYLHSQVYTMPEFLERRFSSHCRLYFATISLVLYVFTKISVALYAGAIILQELLGWSFSVSCVALVLATGSYTLLGGLAAVIYTEVLQCVVLIAGGVVLLVIGLDKVGGLSKLLSESNTRGHLFAPASSPYFPWTGVFFGMPFTSIYYWCTDQVIVQRALSAKSMSHARGGAILAAYFKILPPFLMVIPGLIAYQLYPEKVSQNNNVAFPYMVGELVPSPLLGIIVASMLAALMSSLASVFNSSSTIFAMDIWSRFRTRPSERELVYVGRTAVGVITICGLLWIPLISLLSEQLYLYTHKMMAYFAPPVTVLFIVGIAVPRVNALGAHCTLIFGFFVGLMRLGLEIASKTSSNSFVLLLGKSNFLHFAAVFGWACVVVLLSCSLLAPPPPKKNIHGLTWKLRKSRGISDTDNTEDNVEMFEKSMDDLSLKGDAEAESDHDDDDENHLTSMVQSAHENDQERMEIKPLGAEVAQQSSNMDESSKMENLMAMLATTTLIVILISIFIALR